MTNWRAQHRAAQRLPAALEGPELLVTGRVASMPIQRAGAVRFLFSPELASEQGRAVVLPRKLQLAWYFPRDRRGDALAGHAARGLQAGDRWRFPVRLKAPHGSANPHGFDYELWLWDRDIGATGYVRTTRSSPAPQLLERAAGYRVERWRAALSRRVDERLGVQAGGARARRAGIITALANGDQGAIAQADWQVFRITGVAHLVAISGLHISMVAWLLALAAGGAWRRLCRRYPRLAERASVPTVMWLGGLAAALAYGLFSGWGVPAQRTVIMLATLTCLRLCGLRWPWWLYWLWAAAVVLAVDPWAGLQAGFWLSFAAIGILFLVAPMGRVVERPRLHERFLELLRVQGLVTLALAPLTLILFGQASVIGLLANLLAIPWVTMLVTPAALLGILFWPFWQVADLALIPLLAILHALAGLPGAQLTAPAAPLALGFAAAAGAIIMVLNLPLRLRALGLPLFLPLLLWQVPRPLPGIFELLVADVGQGTAVLVRTHGHSLLYDAGPRYSEDGDAGERVLLPLLRALGERPQLLILSHPDNDHTGGAARVLSEHPAARVILSAADGAAVPGVASFEPCRAGRAWQWDGVDFELLYPDLADRQAARSSNAYSCVLRISASGGSALLTGDLEAPQEKRLLGKGVELASDVLLVPHHGSKTSSTGAFLDAVRPRFALAQNGYRNRFGHPAAEVASRYSDRGIPLYSSPACGAMHWRSDRPQDLSCERQLRRRYWQHSYPGG